MLKALELSGFKSFADRTRFEFPPGITVVVGPNGSGKSNIVDAIKWVLGEQSAKSLRGREMADVIFKGSGGNSGTRKPANAAEVTIHFDNSGGLLPVDTEEVRVTRRVYRSGEGEYAINGNPCRLRDVKDLFRGTGMGTDAYSLIEQGKVDTLLQASPRDRRAIFEEAAGISRFKAKKVETQRRLERVEQNLQRLSDIVEEVESQLRSVRNQASKARRYKEYTDRLKELRTHVGLADWRRFTEEHDKLTAQLTEVREASERTAAEATALEAQREAMSQQHAALDAELKSLEARVSEAVRELSNGQTTIQYEHQHVDELAHEILRYRRQWHAMSARAGDLGQQLQEFNEALRAAETEDREIATRLTDAQAELSATETELSECRRHRDEQRTELVHQQRIANDVERRLGLSESELESTRQQIERNDQQRASVAEQCEESRAEQSRLSAIETELQVTEQAAKTHLTEARQKLQSLERELNQQHQHAVDLQRRFTVASERANVLQDLERRNEGLNPGVKDLLQRAQNAPLGALATLRGMVADLIRVDVRVAPLIDAALGELTQYVVVDGEALLEQVAAADIALHGRVGVLDASVKSAVKADRMQFQGDRSVLGLADEFVEAESKYNDLLRRLLGHTVCVETLRDAVRLHRQIDGPWRYVTRAGEILEADGSLQAGPRQAALGLVSRRSELRSLQHEIIDLEPQMRAVDQQIASLKDEIAQVEAQVGQFTEAFDDVASQLMNARLATRAAADRVTTLDEHMATLEDDRQRLISRRDELEAQQAQHASRHAEVAEHVTQLEAQIVEHDARLETLEASHQSQLAHVTEIKVERAKSEQRLDHLSGQLVRYQEDQRERERSIQETRSQLDAAIEKKQDAERTILRATSALSEWAIQRESLERDLASRSGDQSRQRGEQQAWQQAWDAARRQQQQQDETRHQLELQLNRVKLERDALVQRVREDYEIELSELGDLPDESADEQRAREEVDREINDLRRRLSNIGPVNMAALEEIEALEQRHTGLADQYQDLVEAKDALARIIHKINADSRRLFTESLEIIRANFQALFRRVFGGGHADIVLEEGVDILEAGIDIMATPPGKHSLGISLLSGGERALTAVTLLLAIFQYRPSPFCVLDEVDGPLDEANIGRFIDVLKEFLQWTKFVVVTHSKKTMTAANTLYGVTMQESGVSKRVSVQFDDVSEDGHIRPEALQRNVGSDDSSSSSDGPPPEDDDERGAA